MIKQFQEARIENRQTTWHLINIKARNEQNTEHYIETFKKINAEDPLVLVPRERCESLRSMGFDDGVDNDGLPRWIHITLLAYTIIDPDAFYNRKKQEEVSFEWDSDIVANKKEVELFFIPSVHILAFRRRSPITMNNILRYLESALDKVEHEGFDVEIVKERDVLDRILTAHSIYKIEASISFSNPGHTKGFKAAFDNKIKETGAKRFDVIATGTKDNPLNNSDEDGLIASIVDLSEQNGTVKATIKSTENSKPEIIDSSKHPKVLTIRQIVNGTCATIYNELKSLFGK